MAPPINAAVFTISAPASHLTAAAAKKALEDISVAEQLLFPMLPECSVNTDVTTIVPVGVSEQKAVRVITVEFGPDFIDAYPTAELRLAAFTGLFKGDFAMQLPAKIEYEVHLIGPA